MFLGGSITKKNLEEFAYKTIINIPLGNNFMPSDFLLETELAESLNLSRTPVRKIVKAIKKSRQGKGRHSYEAECSNYI